MYSKKNRGWEENKKEEKTVKFQWITSIEVTKRNIEEMVVAARGRWKIENEGFNNPIA